MLDAKSDWMVPLNLPLLVLSHHVSVTKASSLQNRQ